MIPAAFFAVCAGGGLAGTFSERDGRLVLDSSAYRVAFDANDGRLLSVEDRSGNGTLLTGEDALWQVERLDAEPVTAAAYSRGDRRHAFRHTWDERSETLCLTYASKNLAVAVSCVAGEVGVDCRAAIEAHGNTILRFAFPAGVRFAADDVETFYFPHRIGLGFSRRFFIKNRGAWQPETVGPRAFQFVTGSRCDMRPVEDDPVNLTVTANGEKWLPAWYRKEAANWRLLANRCSKPGSYDLALLQSPHGAYLTGHRLGGWGWLFRLGGFMREGDYRPRFASVVATLYRLFEHTPVPCADGTTIPAHYAKKPPHQWGTKPVAIGVLAFDRWHEPGNRIEGGWRQWVRDLERLPWMEKNDLNVVAIRTLPHLKEVLSHPRDCFLIVNPDSETFPAESADAWRETLAAVREYVRDGGVWWEAGGGYPFYKALVAERNFRFKAAASPLFSDFIHLDSRRGSFSLYGIQGPEAVFVCPEASVRGEDHAGSRHGRFEHAFVTHVPPGKTWQSPVLRLAVGTDMRSSLTAYGRENGYTRPLSEKIDADTLKRLKRSVLIKLSGMPLSEQIATLDSLPRPSLVHICNYLLGGFDKQYPDHLPPNPAVGTAEEFKTLITRCRERGHLFMPYTNPTWWCTKPKGPTFRKAGDAPLSRGLDGNVIAETYGPNPNRGFSVCAFHPAVHAANDRIRTQFLDDYPVDILFQDQVGARYFRYDLNKTAPNGYAYLHGMHGIARKDSRHVPLATEEGHDRVINYETMFCGLSWPWLPNESRKARVLYRDLWPENAFRIEPLALYLAHDKVLFTHHDLGGFILDRNDLVHSLAFGYGMSFVVGRNPKDDPATLQWLDCLARIQRSVVARCAGQPLSAFEYVTRHVIRARWGEVELTANLADEPYTVDGDIVIAPRGYRAVAPGLDAGIFTRYAGKDRSPDGWWLLREDEGDAWTWRGDRAHR